jgi:hypothetical protein
MLNEMAKEIHENAVAHGWWDDERKLPEIVALCHSELSEALEEYRDGKPMEYCTCIEDRKPCEGITCDCWESFDGSCKNNCLVSKPEGIAVEMVDCIIRCLDYLAHESVDIDGVMARKMEYNEGRPYKHGGKVC